MIDPPRPEAKEAVIVAERAGVKTVMITGDHKDTAMAIAEDLGILKGREAVSGIDLDKMDTSELERLVNRIGVYARVSPEHKVRIVEALKKNGNIVAMTGDGVNDALALKKSDIGVSMGITGTEVAKGTADMILTDDNFASIVSAIEEGRIIYSNIRKFVFFLLSCNAGEILTIFIAIVLGFPVPLEPVQLLWLNLVSDSFPALALGVEKGLEDVMDQHPRDPKESILNGEMILGIILQSISIASATLIAFAIGQRTGGVDMGRTNAFITLILGELWRAHTSRSERYSLFKIGIFTNKWAVYATLGSLALLLLVIYVPALASIFNTAHFRLDAWPVLIGLSLVPSIVAELTKAGLRRSKNL
jgi:Ca2+-transporting ATPase